MSETEHRIGKLTPVGIPGDNETTARGLCILNGFGEELKYHGTFIEKLKDDGYNKYFVTKDIIYEITCKDLDPFADIARSSLNSDGTIDFEVRWYNGGASFSEVLESALRNLK